MTKSIPARALAAALLVLATAAPAQATSGYWQNSAGEIWKNSAGECWRTGTWTPAHATAECDPALVQRVARPLPKEADRAPERRLAAPVQLTLQADALFDFDRATLKPEARETLRALVARIDNLSDIDEILIEGHTDSTGSAAYNHGLSHRRAEAVRDYLRAEGVKAAMVVKGYGEHRPDASNATAEGRARNRRVEVLLKAVK